MHIGSKGWEKTFRDVQCKAKLQLVNEGGMRMIKYGDEDRGEEEEGREPGVEGAGGRRREEEELDRTGPRQTSKQTPSLVGGVVVLSGRLGRF